MKIKNIGSIVLMACFVCQVLVVPVYLWFQYEQESNYHTSSLQKIDNPEILELKVSLSLPYASNWEEAKESEGLFEYQGDYYTLVNRHMQNDTLYFKYIKNNNAREIFGLLADHAAVDHADQENTPPSNDYLMKWMASKYIKTSKDFHFEQFEILFTKAIPAVCYSKFYQSPELSLLSPPPKFS